MWSVECRVGSGECAVGSGDWGESTELDWTIHSAFYAPLPTPHSLLLTLHIPAHLTLTCATAACPWASMTRISC